MTILIQNGHVVDPLTKRDEVCDVLVADGKIRKVGVSLQDEADRILDATGCYVMPGFIDLHVHFRRQAEKQRSEGELPPYVRCRIPDR